MVQTEEYRFSTKIADLSISRIYWDVLYKNLLKMRETLKNQEKIPELIIVSVDQSDVIRQGSA